MRYVAAIALAFLATSIIPAAAQNSVLFSSNATTNTCAGLLMNWGCAPPLLPGGATVYSCRSTEVTYQLINSFWTTSLNVPPGYLCIFQYCGPGGVTVVCNGRGKKTHALTIKAAPAQH